MNPSQMSGSVIAAGVVAILGSCLAILGCAFALLGTMLLPSTPADNQLPPIFKAITVALTVFFLAIAIFGIFTGVGILRRKNWARISAMVWAGITTPLCVLVLLFTLFMPSPTAPQENAPSLLAVKVFLLLFYAIPIGTGIWWLILFTRPNVRAQFSGEVLPTQPEASERPRCPLPVAVIAGFLLFSFPFVLLFPLLHIPIPVILFGHRIHGQLGSGIFAFTAVLSLAAGIGLLRLKQWSYPLVIGLQSFWLLSGTISFLSPSHERNMREFMDEMHVPQADVAAQSYLHSHSWPFLVGFLPSIVILVILSYYRVPFWKAAHAAEEARLP